MLTRNEVRKLAWLQISGVVEAMALDYAFGDELTDLAFDDGCSWVTGVLEDVRSQAARRLTPKQLRGRANDCPS
ncbi:hypothetical protein LCGC14_0336650 [marine sediment metagenome]|uniref:Uncharacterized protein n=1 Tax=marine sediment metagenome TaxID=412755 RepID=A0A0F9TF62_9ZZZZ